MMKSIQGLVLGSLVLALSACNGDGGNPAFSVPGGQMEDPSDCFYYEKSNFKSYIEMAEVACVKKGLMDGIDPNGEYVDTFFNKRGPYLELALTDSALFFAKAKGGAGIILNLLFNYGGDVNKKFSNGETLLEKALRVDSKYDSVSDFVMSRRELDVNAISKGGTAIEIAILLKNEWAVQRLVGRSANPNQKTKQDSPLIQAMEQGLERAAQSLVKAGADLKVADSHGNGVLALAMKLDSYALFDLMIEKGASITVKNAKAQTPLIIASQVESDYFFKRLMGMSITLDDVDQEDKSALYYAVQGDHILRVNDLLEKNAKLDGVTAQGETLLHVVNSAAIALILIENGAPKNALDKNGESAFSHAVKTNQIGVVAALLLAGTDTGWVSGDGETLLHLSVKRDLLDMTHLLLMNHLKLQQRDHSRSTPILSVRSAEMAELLVKKGASLADADGEGFHVMKHVLSQTAPSLKLIQYLIKQGVDLNADIKAGFNPLSWFMLKAGTEVDEEESAVMRAMLAAGVNTNQLNNYGNAPIHYVNNLETLKLLIEFKVALNTRNSQYFTLRDSVKARIQSIEAQIKADTAGTQRERLTFLLNQLKEMESVLAVNGG